MDVGNMKDKQLALCESLAEKVAQKTYLHFDVDDTRAVAGLVQV